MYPLGTWFVSGIRVRIHCIKERTMMMIIIIIIIIQLFMFWQIATRPITVTVQKRKGNTQDASNKRRYVDKK
jgi:hypothetical protein